jgi:hypothetical protein
MVKSAEITATHGRKSGRAAAGSSGQTSAEHRRYAVTQRPRPDRNAAWQGNEGPRLMHVAECNGRCVRGPLDITVDTYAFGGKTGPVPVMGFCETPH